MRNADVLLLSGRHPLGRMWRERESHVLGCNNLKFPSYWARKGERGSKSWFKYHRLWLFLPCFSRFSFLICCMPLVPFPETLNDCFEKKKIHTSFTGKWVDKESHAVLPEVGCPNKVYIPQLSFYSFLNLLPHSLPPQQITTSNIGE